MYKIKRFSCMMEFIQKEFNKRTKSKRKADRTKTNVVMHTNKGRNKAIEALAEVDNGNLERAEELNNQAKRLQQTAKGEAAKFEGQVRDLAKNTTENANGVKNITIGDSKVKVDSDSVRIVGKPQGNRTAVTVSEGDVDIHRKTGKGATVNIRSANTDTITHHVDNRIKNETEMAKRNMSKEWLHSKPASQTPVGVTPAQEVMSKNWLKPKTQVAEEVVAHKPAAPTMEQIAKEGANDVKKVTKGLGKWGKAGLITAGTLATAGLAYGGKKLYDKKRAKEANYSDNSDYRQSSKYHNDVAKSGAALGATGLGIGAWAGYDIAKNAGKVKEARDLVASGKMSKEVAGLKYGKNLKGLSRGIYNAGSLALPLATVGAITYGVSKHRANKLEAQGK